MALLWSLPAVELAVSGHVRDAIALAAVAKGAKPWQAVGDRRSVGRITEECR